MLNKTSMLLAVSVVALGAGAAHADDGNRNHQDNPAAVTMPGEPNQPVYGNGYNYGYDDGYARRERDDRYRADAWRAHDGDHGYQHGDRGYQRGAYYYGSDCQRQRCGRHPYGCRCRRRDRQPGGPRQWRRDGRRRHSRRDSPAIRSRATWTAATAITPLTSYSAGLRRTHRPEAGLAQRQQPRQLHADPGIFAQRQCLPRLPEASYRGDGYHYARNGTACRRNDGNWYME